MTSHKDKKRCLSLFFYGDTDVADAKRYMREINLVLIKTKLKVGDIIIKNMLETDINLIATDEIMIGEQ